MSNRTVGEADRTRNNRSEDLGKNLYFCQKDGDAAKWQRRVEADRDARESAKYRGVAR